MQRITESVTSDREHRRNRRCNDEGYFGVGCTRDAGGAVDHHRGRHDAMLLPKTRVARNSLSFLEALSVDKGRGVDPSLSTRHCFSELETW